MAEDKYSCEHLLARIDVLRKCIVDREKEGKLSRYDVSRMLPSLENLMHDFCDFTDNY